MATIITSMRNAMVQAAANSLPSGSSLVLYSGTPPTNINTALSGNTVLATFTTAGWGAPSTGTITAAAISSVVAAASGTGTFVRVLVSTVPTYQENVGSGVTIDNANIVSGGNVNVTSWALTQPA